MSESDNSGGNGGDSDNGSDGYGGDNGGGYGNGGAGASNDADNSDNNNNSFSSDPSDNNMAATNQDPNDPTNQDPNELTNQDPIDNSVWGEIQAVTDELNALYENIQFTTPEDEVEELNLVELAKYVATAQPQFRTIAPEFMTYARNGTPVPSGVLRANDDTEFGTPIQAPDGTYYVGPADFNLDDFVESVRTNPLGPAGLMAFAPGFSYDMQRSYNGFNFNNIFNGDTFNHSFTSFASYAYGLGAAAQGLSVTQALVAAGIENLASVTRTYVENGFKYTNNLLSGIDPNTGLSKAPNFGFNLEDLGNNPKNTPNITNGVNSYQNGISPQSNYGNLPERDNPIILDLTGHGIKITQLQNSSQFFDMRGDGLKSLTAWAGVGNAILFYDATGRGQLTQTNQFVFTNLDPAAQNDMQAVADLYDANHNGKLDASDTAYGKFFLKRAA